MDDFAKAYFDSHFKNDNRKCEKCGITESFDNIIMKYNIHDEILLLCDDCLLEVTKDVSPF